MRTLSSLSCTFWTKEEAVTGDDQWPRTGQQNFFFFFLLMSLFLQIPRYSIIFLIPSYTQATCPVKGRIPKNYLKIKGPFLDLILTSLHFEFLFRYKVRNWDPIHAFDFNTSLSPDWGKPSVLSGDALSDTGEHILPDDLQCHVF